nr:peptidylprolyl isomerase [Sphingomonas sp. Y57]
MTAATDPGSVIGVRLTTAMGDIEIDIFPDRAPETCGAFLRLVDEEKLTGAAFYRAVRPTNDRGSPPISILQARPSPANEPVLSVPHEPTCLTGLRHGDGAVAIGRNAPGTGSPGHFYICLGNQPALDHGGARFDDGEGAAVFGQVVAGLDVIRAIHALPCEASAPTAYLEGQMLTCPVAIRSARRL